MRVWDISIRIFHWLLVAGIASQFFTMKFGDGEYTKLHFYGGFVILGLVVYRVIWGFVGTSTARFAQFLYSPNKIWAYLQQLPSKEYTPHLGHNPIGGISVILMLLVVAMMAVSGLFMSDDIIWDGPFYGSVSDDFADVMRELHEIGEKLLIALMVLHIGAIVFYRVRKRVALVPPMITGKSNAEGLEHTEAKPVSVTRGWCGLVLLVIAAGGCWWWLSSMI